MCCILKTHVQNVKKQKMFRNKELTDENIIIYKKIVTRHLKELGIYTVVKREFFSKHNFSFDHYIRKNKALSAIICNAVGVLWAMVDSVVGRPTFAASLFLMKVLSDEAFFEMVASQCNDKERARQVILITVRDEINYLSNRDTGDWENVSLEYANMIYDIAKRVCKQMPIEFNNIFQKLILVNGFECRK